MPVALSLHHTVVSSAVPSSADMGIMAPRRLHLAGLQLEQESIPISWCQHDGRGAQHREGEGVPLMVFLELLVLGVLPASVLAIVVTLLGVLSVVACSVLSCVLGGVSGTEGACVVKGEEVEGESRLRTNKEAHRRSWTASRAP